MTINYKTWSVQTEDQQPETQHEAWETIIRKSVQRGKAKLNYATRSWDTNHQNASQWRKTKHWQNERALKEQADQKTSSKQNHSSSAVYQKNRKQARKYLARPATLTIFTSLFSLLVLVNTCWLLTELMCLILTRGNTFQNKSSIPPSSSNRRLVTQSDHGLNIRRVSEHVATCENYPPLRTHAADKTSTR